MISIFPIKFIDKRVLNILQARAWEEQRKIFGDDRNRPVSFDDIHEMKYLELVIKEALRMYPPVPFYARTSNVDIKYKGIIFIYYSSCICKIFIFLKKVYYVLFQF